MSAYDYCRDKVALPGSSLYYSVLFAAPELRVSLTALHALSEEFQQMVDNCSEERIARAKLGWWAEEMHRACAGQARHPVTLALSEALQRKRVELERFTHALDALGEHLSRHGYRSLSELEAHYERLADINGCLAAEFCGFEDDATAMAARELGAGLALAALARRPNRRSARGVTDFPEQTLSTFGATAADLDAPRTTAALKDAIRCVADRARARLLASLECMPEQDRAAQSCRRALAQMELAQLRKLERMEFAALERPAAITPLRKLWIAWKYRL